MVEPAQWAEFQRFKGHPRVFALSLSLFLQRSCELRAMAFTTDEILSYFTLKGANPLTSRLPENIDLLPAPGRGLFVRGREEAERRGNERDYSFGPRERRDGGDQRPGAGFGNPVYNLDKMEDVDVEEDYFQPLPPLLDDYGGRGAGDTVGVASLYERYSFDTDNSPHLPVTERREDVVRTVESNQVTIIHGATGSGKSTLVPQYILEHHARRHRHCNIVCTQPRRLATRSIAQYVAKTRGWKLGTIVGYQIYNDKVTSEDTRLTFVTTGVLLEKLIGMKNMNEYTHVILDEVRGSPYSLNASHSIVSVSMSSSVADSLSLHW